MSYFKIQKDDDRKEFVSFLVMGEGDKYYLPNFEKKSYLRVPKGYVLYLYLIHISEPTRRSALW